MHWKGGEMKKYGRRETLGEHQEMKRKKPNTIELLLCAN